MRPLPIHLVTIILGGLLSLGAPAHAFAAPRKVAALGRLEPRGGVIVIAAVPGERIEALPAQLGALVEPGDELAVLSGHRTRELQLQLARTQRDEALQRAEANLRAARALHEEALLGVEAAESADGERLAQEARSEAAGLTLVTAREELERLSGLESRLVPVQTLERKRLLVRQAEIDANAQRTLLARMEAAAGLRRRAAEAKLKSAEANIALAESATRLESLDKAIEVAERSLELARVVAPQRGRVIDVLSRVGEVTGPRPILRLADTDFMQVVAEVYETDIGHVRVGQPVSVRAEALTGDRRAVVKGRVAAIGSVVGGNEVQALGLPPTAEQRVVKVWIDLDATERAASLINLQVDVEFDVEGAPGGQGTSTR